MPGQSGKLAENDNEIPTALMNNESEIWMEHDIAETIPHEFGILTASVAGVPSINSNQVQAVDTTDVISNDTDLLKNEVVNQEKARDNCIQAPTGEDTFEDELKKWFVNTACNINHAQSLLKILKPQFPQLPLSYKTY